MTLLNVFSFRGRVRATDTHSEDRSVMLMLVLLLGLVLAPVAGLHIAVIAFGSPATSVAPNNLAHHHGMPAKPARG
jgi:hypothetical protein